MSGRITLAAGDPEDHPGTGAGAQPLDILMSPATHSEWGLPSEGHESHPISLGQIVPILQTGDGYLDTLVQETLVATYLAAPSRNWLMQVADSFREVNPAPVITITANGKGKRACKAHSTMPRVKSKGKGRGRGKAGRSSLPLPHPTVPATPSVVPVGIPVSASVRAGWPRPYPRNHGRSCGLLCLSTPLSRAPPPLRRLHFYPLPK